MERKCLHCEKGYKAKREASKFCSTSCRVMFSRKNKGKEKKAAEKTLLLQTNVLLNSVLDAVGKINFGVVPTILDAPRNLNPVSPEPIVTHKATPFKTLAQYKTEKLELENEEQYAEWLAEIQADPNFSSKQKDLIIKYN